MTRASRVRPDPGLVVSRGVGPAAAAAAATAREPRRGSLARLLGATGMVVLTIVLLWLLTDASFRVSQANVEIEGLVHSDEAVVRAHLSGLDRSPNAFRVRASEIVSRLQELPEVASASARVRLPAGLAVEVRERQPLFAWTDGLRTLLVDREGVLFGSAEGAEGLPLVKDDRLVEPWQPGARLPATDLAVMRQLLALTPELLGSSSEHLALRVDEEDGYVLEGDQGWQAVFGHYTPTLQPPDAVPRQVQCLTWLLADRERTLDRATLAIAGGGCGTLRELVRRG